MNDESGARQGSLRRTPRVKKESEPAGANGNVGNQRGAGGAERGGEVPSAPPAGAGSLSKGDKRWGGSRCARTYCLQVEDMFMGVVFKVMAGGKSTAGVSSLYIIAAAGLAPKYKSIAVQVQRAQVQKCTVAVQHSSTAVLYCNCEYDAYYKYEYNKE